MEITFFKDKKTRILILKEYFSPGTPLENCMEIKKISGKRLFYDGVNLFSTYSVSHYRNVSVVACAREPIGVDLESASKNYKIPIDPVKWTVIESYIKILELGVDAFRDIQIRGNQVFAKKLNKVNFQTMYMNDFVCSVSVFSELESGVFDDCCYCLL